MDPWSLKDVVRLLLLLSCFVVPVFSQLLTIGAKGGLRLTDDVPTHGASNSKRYVVGPMIELGLPYHFAFEVDALYSRLGNTFSLRLIGLGEDKRTIANSWEFPLLVKYRLPVSRVNPFLSIGVAPRYVGGRINTIRYGFLPGDITFASENWHAHDRSLVFSAGIGIPTGRIHIAPEIRYFKRKVPGSPSSDDVAFYLRPPRNDEFQILLGIGLSRKSR